MSEKFFNTKSGQYIALGVAGIAGVVFVVWYFKKQAKEALDAAAGLVTGDNAITKNQTNLSGEKLTDYEGKGVLGTLGAAANSISGGSLASLGQWLGGKTFDVVQWVKGEKPPSNLTYIILFADGSKRAVDSNAIDSNGYFSFEGRPYRLGLNSASEQYAVAL